MLLKRLDDAERRWHLRQLPARDQLTYPLGSPLLDQPSRGARQNTADYRTVTNRHQRLVLAIDRVEVRRVVIREVHVDHDPVKLAQPRHHMTLPSSASRVADTRIRPSRIERAANDGHRRHQRHQRRDRE